ncbi:MAG: response regulator [Tepidisphaeraceae bacterium]
MSQPRDQLSAPDEPPERHTTHGPEGSDETLREFQHMLLESQRLASMGSYVLDITTGIWTSSPALDELFGITDPAYPKDVPGWLRIIHPDERERMRHYLNDHVLAQRQAFDTEYRIVRLSDHAERWVHGRGRLTFDAQNRPLRMIGTIQDITERKRAEEERLALQRQMEQTQRLESLGVLAGGIAHDFNNLLMVVLGYADLAMRQASPMSPARESLAEIEKAGRRAAELCRQMLAYSGRGKFILETIVLGSLVEEMAHLLKATISKKAMLTLDLEKSIPPMEGDAAQVRQIVMNLITNASEAIGDRSGVIRISTGAMECSRAHLSATYLDDNLAEGLYVYIEVADTGCGMSRETIGRMFEPFFTTKFTGRGLGMAAVLGIVRGHKGAIHISSELGTGTTIRVLFPAHGNGTARAIVAARPADPSSKATGRVLLVDDEDTLRLLGSRMLGLIGYEVLTAADGQQAVELYQSRWKDIDVVVLDLTMPRMDGEETLLALQHVNPEVRVVMTSGYTEHEIFTRFAGKRLAGFLQKPYTLSTLKEVFRQITR